MPAKRTAQAPSRPARPEDGEPGYFAYVAANLVATGEWQMPTDPERRREILDQVRTNIAIEETDASYLDGINYQGAAKDCRDFARRLRAFLAGQEG